MRITIVNYGIGNLGSIINMFKKVGIKALETGSPEMIADAEKILLPGVGAFDEGMKNLHGSGLLEILNKKARTDKVPILGVCLGMQLLTEKSEEGVLPGLGWIPGETKKFSFGINQSNLKVPHMGWDYVKVARDNALYADMPPNPRFYFVHSYHVVCKNKSDVIGTTDYGLEFCSSLQHENIWGAQFHPEKSHKFGMQLLRNFAAL